MELLSLVWLLYVYTVSFLYCLWFTIYDYNYYYCPLLCMQYRFLFCLWLGLHVQLLLLSIIVHVFSTTVVLLGTPKQIFWNERGITFLSIIVHTVLFLYCLWELLLLLSIQYWFFCILFLINHIIVHYCSYSIVFILFMITIIIIDHYCAQLF